MIRNLRIYLTFLGRNKVYTFVSIFGFSVSIMFVILLGLYAKQQLSVDSFHKNKDRIYLMTRENSAAFSNSIAPYVMDLCPEVESFCRAISRDVQVGEIGLEKIPAYCLFVDSTFFSMFSFQLLEGLPNQVLTSKNSVVLTKTFALKLYGEENALGKVFTIDGIEHIVTGIMADLPENTQFPQVDFIASYFTITYYWGEEVLTVHNNFGFGVYLMAKKGADLLGKREFLLDEFKKDIWLYSAGYTESFELLPLEDVYFNIKYISFLELKMNNKNILNIYIAIVILILLIATLNYVNMTVAQAGFRGKEAAMKKLLGGSKQRIIRQIISESLLMTLFAFALGLFLAFLFEPFFNDVLNTRLELAYQFTPLMIAILGLFILLVAFVSGVIPALLIASFNPLEVVKGSFSKKVKATYSKVLIVFQFAVAIVLLISTIFIKQQSDYLINYDLGYNHEAVFTMDIRLDTVQTVGFKNKLLSLPGVEAVSYSAGTPMDRGNNRSFDIDGQTYSTQVILADEEFFDIYGIITNPIDVRLGDDNVFINNNLYNSPLVDKQTMIIDLAYDGKVEIAGVLNDFHIGSLNINAEYISYLRIHKLESGMRPWSISIKLTNTANVLDVAERIKKEYTAYTGGKLPKNSAFADDTIQQWYEREQKLSSILTAFTLLTILIAIMGVFAMSLYLVKQKEKEIGVRKVNGATEGQILWMLNKASLIRVLIAFVIACPIAYYAVSKWLESFSYKITITFWPFLLAGLVITVLTLLSVSFLTWRAATANPVESLKSE